MAQRSTFWHWRHARPFWGGLLVLLGGIEIMLTVWAPLPVILHIGLTGLAGYLVPALLILCGVLLLVNPQQRLFYSLLSAMLALGSWITSNLGGFFIGLLLALVGAALAFAWSPDKKRVPPKEEPAPRAGTAGQPHDAGDTASWPLDDDTVVPGQPGDPPDAAHSARHSRTTPAE